MNPKITAPKLIAVAASLAILGGCASTSSLEEVRRAAESAQIEAAEAKALAIQAQGTANEALGTANMARQDAAEAKQISEQNSLEVNRMFRRTMQK